MHPFIEVLLSLAAIYILLSIINSAILETLARAANDRGIYLKKKIGNFFRDSDSGDSFVNKLYNNHLIKAYHNRTRPPSSIDKQIFAQSLMEMLFQEQQDSLTKRRDLEGNEIKLPDEVQKALDYILKKAPEEMDKKLEYIQKEIEKLYDLYMERVTNWYKQRQRLFLIGLAFVGGLIYNLDSIHIANQLIKDAELRRTYVDVAYSLDRHRQSIRLDSTEVAFALGPSVMKALYEEDKLNDLFKLLIPDSTLADKVQLTDLGIGLGYFNNEKVLSERKHGTIISLVGILLTSFCLSFGSTFWFDILKRLVNLPIK